VRPSSPNAGAGHERLKIGRERRVDSIRRPRLFAASGGAAPEVVGLRVFRSTVKVSSATRSSQSGSGYAVKRKCFSVEQVAAVLQQVEAGSPVQRGVPASWNRLADVRVGFGGTHAQAPKHIANGQLMVARSGDLSPVTIRARESP
jgi:hypothetical protein